MLKLSMVTFIYLKLSVFQKQHAEVKIFNNVNSVGSVINEKAFAN